MRDGGYPFALEPGPVRPSDLRGLALWLDAADGKTLLADDLNPAPLGTAIRQWSDKGPNGFHATQLATGPRPAYVTAGGMPGVQFDGVDDVLSVAAPTLLAGKPGATVFLAIRAASVGGGFIRPFLASSGAGATTTRLSVNRLTGELPQLVVRRLDADTAASVTAGSAATLSKLEIECHTVDLGAQTAAVRRNGADVGTASGILSAGSFDAAVSAGVSVGSSAGSNVLAGTLHEVVVYARGLAPGERASVERYLRAKWGTA